MRLKIQGKTCNMFFVKDKANIKKKEKRKRKERGAVEKGMKVNDKSDFKLRLILSDTFRICRKLRDWKYLLYPKILIFKSNPIPLKED